MGNENTRTEHEWQTDTQEWCYKCIECGSNWSGIGSQPTPPWKTPLERLQDAWEKANTDEQTKFIQWIGLQQPLQRTKFAKMEECTASPPPPTVEPPGPPWKGRETWAKNESDAT